MTISRLVLYNGALRELGERKLSSLTENREPRRVIDDVWDAGAVDYCLAAAQWRFARRTVQLYSESAMEQEFGYKKAYRVPDDHLRTCAVSADEYCNEPLTRYRFESDFWFSDDEPIYVSYVSNSIDYGNDYAKWPADFARYVETYIAMQACERLSQNENKFDKLFKLTERRLKEAASSDAMEDPTVFPPVGRWVSARFGRGSGRRERGPGGSLLG